MVRTLLILLFFTFISKMGIAQETYVKSESKFITKFSFQQLTGGIVLLRATFNNLTDTFNFVLDTGSGAISLDSGTVSEFNIPNEPSGYTVSGIAGVRKVNYSVNNTLHFPGLSIDSLNFFINDYELLSSVYGVKIDGIIGYSFLSRYIVELNYDDKIISVFTPGKFKYPKGSHILNPAFTALPAQEVGIKDARSVQSKFYIDTGAGLYVLLNNQFVTDSSFLKKKRKPVPFMIQGVGGKINSMFTVITRLKLGPYVFRNIPTIVFDDQFNALSYPIIGGLVGNDILRRFNTILNYPERLIVIKPNKHFHDPFDFSYTGMNMYMEPGGRIVIDDIIEGSPADKYGLMPGDILMGVNHNFTGNISVYRDLMKTPGERVSLIVSRDGKLKSIKIKVGRIR